MVSVTRRTHCKPMTERCQNRFSGVPRVKIMPAASHTGIDDQRENGSVHPIFPRGRSGGTPPWDWFVKDSVKVPPAPNRSAYR
jgi:hypothetical protein